MMNKKLVTLLLTLVMALSFSAVSFAAAGEIGFVSIPMVYSQYPGIEGINKQLNAEKTRLEKLMQKEFAGKSDKEKQTINQKYNQDFGKFEAEKIGPVNKAIGEAIAKVAKNHAIKSVVGSPLLYTEEKPVDLTKEVVEIIKK